jgi:hypothetical protein
MDATNMENLTAMPAIFDGLWVPAYAATQSTRQHFIKAAQTKRNHKVYGTFGLYDQVVYCFTDNYRSHWLYSLNPAKDDLVYVMHLSFQSLSADPALPPDQRTLLTKKTGFYQSSVWTNSAYGMQRVGLPSSVFWSLFGSLKHIALSDTQQSMLGKRFWELRISEAFQRSRKVLALHFADRSGKVSEVAQFSSPMEVDNEPYWTYERKNDDRGLNWRFAII